MSRPFSPRGPAHPATFVRINGKIRAREVRVIGVDGQQLGILTLNDAIAAARANGVDLVEVASNATPPVCRLVDFGKYRYELSKKEKDSKKHQHANRVKEIQLSPTIDSHDFQVKLTHAIDFLCEEMKVKLSLRFRGREMAHQEFGFQTVSRFTKELAPFGHPDAPPKLIGRGLTAMISPLPRNRRAKNPRQAEIDAEAAANRKGQAASPPGEDNAPEPAEADAPDETGETAAETFQNSPFSNLDGKLDTVPVEDQPGSAEVERPDPR